MSIRNMLVVAVRSLRRGIASVANPGRIRFGRGTVVGPGLRVVRGASLLVGDQVGIGANVTVMAAVTIGDDCLVSSSVAFVGNDHEFEDPSSLIREQASHFPALISLEGDNLVGFGTTVVGDVRIGYGAVIGAGSLVTGDVEPFSVNIGRPARVIRYRNSRRS